MGEQNYDTANERLIAREERKLERAKDKLKASEKNLRKSLAKEIARNKQSVAKDALDATKDNNRRDTWSSKAGGGNFVDDGEVVTGYEDRVWERE